MSDQSLRFQEFAGNNMTRRREMLDRLPIMGVHRTEHFRRDKDGILKLFAVHVALNDITTVGKNKLFDTMFNAATQQAATDFCAGLINNAGFTGYNIADTMASHSGWTEWTSYSQTTRVTWGQGAAAAAAITNASPMVFDINGTGTIRGLFITTQNTKGGTSGLLWSAASYTSTVDVVPGDQIRSTYSLSC